MIEDKQSPEFFSKALDDRLNIIEDSVGHSLYETPINKIQGSFIGERINPGIDYLMNYQTIHLSDAINISVYVNSLYPYINETERLKDHNNNDTIYLNRTDDVTDLVEI